MIDYKSILLLLSDYGTPGNDGSGTSADAIKSTKPISPLKRRKQKSTPPNVTLSATSKQDLEQTNEEVKAKKKKKKFDKAAYLAKPHFGEETTKPEPVVTKTPVNTAVNKKNNNPKAASRILNSMKVKKPLIEPITTLGNTVSSEDIDMSTIQETYLELLTEKRGRPRKDATDPKWKATDAAVAHHADSDSSTHIHSSMMAAANHHGVSRAPSSEEGSGEAAAEKPHIHKFANGEEHAISREHAHAYLKKAAAMKPEDRLSFHQRTNKSHEHFRAGLGLQGAPAEHKSIVDHMHDATKVKGFEQHHVPFGGGMHPHPVEYRHAKKFLEKHAAASPAVKSQMEKVASKSHEHFMRTIG